MENVLCAYTAFCKRLNIPEEIHLVIKLEKCIADKSEQPVKKPEEEKREERKLPKKEDSDAIAVKNKEEGANKENGQEPPENAEEDLPSRPIYGHVVVSDCVICMEKTREIVFLPCSHFLTCPLCAPRVIKCPMCNQRIEKHLKISWS